MSTGLDTGDNQPHTVGCWCCGQSYPPDRMVHLGTHPEVTVCADCARFLHRRAALLGAHATPVALIRRATQTIRDQVLSRQIHERRVVGPFLRWLDRFLP